MGVRRYDAALGGHPLRPSAIDETTALVPDLTSYQMMNPVLQPGVAEDLVLPGWDVTGSSFDYRPARYNANVGFEGFEGLKAPPELYFNVAVRRRFLGPFVSTIIPLLVAASMLFSLLLISSKTGSLSKFSGFSAKDDMKVDYAVKQIRRLLEGSNAKTMQP